MAYMASLGLWSDVPRISYDEPEASDEKGSPHLPLPDGYLSEILKKSIWITNNLSSSLFNVLRAIPRVWADATDLTLTEGANVARRMDALSGFLATHAWTDAEGQSIDELPFIIKLSSRGRRSALEILQAEDLQYDEEQAADAAEMDDDRGEVQTDWPPLRFADVMVLAGALQRANLMQVGICLGGRASELCTQLRDAVSHRKDGTAQLEGLTFKFSDKEEGELRPWPLPEVAQNAIAVQLELVRLAEVIPRQSEMVIPTDLPPPADDASRPLWIMLGSCGGHASRVGRLRGVNGAIRGYVRTLGMDLHPGGQRIRSHRLRKSLARLVGLALSDAPTLLMDIFGHSGVGQALYYMLADRAFFAEHETVLREIAVAKSSELIDAVIAREVAQEDPIGSQGMSNSSSAEAAGLGGGAALKFEAAVRNELAELHQAGMKWGASDTASLAKRLTLNGKAWMLVRPGVVCTRSPGSVPGPCNFSLGRPDPSACQPRCSHRLEEHFLRADVEHVLEEAVSAYTAAVHSGDDLMAYHWAGQVRGNLHRFEDVRLRWTKRPDVQQLLARLATDEADLDEAEA